MAREGHSSEDYVRPVRRILVGLMVALMFLTFILWRIDSPRIERLRAQVVDRVVPSFDWVLVPVTGLVNLAENFRSYGRIYEQNQELRRELQKMRAWKEAALQLEQENARLRDLNNVRLDARLSYVTGVVLADSGSPFRQSVLVNVGTRDGIVDGWAAMDGLGLVGRISGVGPRSARVLLLTDSSSRIPVTVQPSGQKALLYGDGTLAPTLEFLENPDLVRPGDRVVSSGDGGVFPAGLLVGHVAQGRDRRLRVRLAADYERLAFLRVLRAQPEAPLTDPGSVVGALLATPLGAEAATPAPAADVPAPGPAGQGTAGEGR